MGCLPRFSTLLLAGLAIACAAPALADSKLFSVKTTTPGLTVDHAFADGRDLPVSGQGGGVTFFRL